MNRKTIVITAAVLVAILTATLFFRGRDQKNSTPKDAKKLTAMYVPYGEAEYSSYIMVDQNSGSVFTVTMPSKIYDINGKGITPEELVAGNILEIYGDGIMLESFPGQYPGVSQINVLQQGSPEDIRQYQDIIDQIYQKPNPAEPPTLNLEYRTTDAVVTAAVTRGGYTWNFKDENGDSQQAEGDGGHILSWEEMNDITLKSPEDISLYFSKKPQNVTVDRWPSTAKGTFEDEAGAQQKVALNTEGELPVIEEAEAGYIYRIQAEWEDGTAEYGFLTK